MLPHWNQETQTRPASFIKTWCFGVEMEKVCPALSPDLNRTPLNIADIPTSASELINDLEHKSTQPCLKISWKAFREEKSWAYYNRKEGGINLEWVMIRGTQTFGYNVSALSHSFHRIGYILGSLNNFYDTNYGYLLCFNAKMMMMIHVWCFNSCFFFFTSKW